MAAEKTSFVDGFIYADHEAGAETPGLRARFQGKMADENEPLPWDYFLTDYERDLLRLPIENALRKYPSISREQMESDSTKMREMQASFERENGQDWPDMPESCG